MTLAPAGMVTAAPTASILPSRMTIVPFSITGFDTGTIRALVIASTPFVLTPAVIFGASRARSACPAERRVPGTGEAAADPAGSVPGAAAAPPPRRWPASRSAFSAATRSAFSFSTFATRSMSACRS